MTDSEDSSSELEGNSSAENTSEPTWMWDENTPGVGDRPDYLPEKFKSVAEAAKSYSHLEKKLGSAPKEYDFSAADSWLKAGNEEFSELSKFAKEKHVPQEVMTKMLESTTKYLESQKHDLQAEREKLGGDYKDRINKLDNWAKSNLTENSYSALTASMKTAESIVALEEMRTLMMGENTMVPNGTDTGHSDSITLQDVQDELQNNLEKYKTDSKYRKEITGKLERASKDSGRVDKNSGW